MIAVQAPTSLYRVLLAEDDECSRFLILRVLTRVLGSRGTVHAVHDGEMAIEYLAGEGIYADRERYPFPNMLVTDLNMPRRDGFEVLHFLQTNPAWCVTPRIVFTCSCDPDDVRTAYALGASAFHQKPYSVGDMMACFERIFSYWLACHVPLADASGRVRNTLREGKLGSRFPVADGGSKMLRVARDM
jgi:CheY-like chemotaxis protein